jgi:hypothetical protein
MAQMLHDPGDDCFNDGHGIGLQMLGDVRAPQVVALGHARERLEVLATNGLVGDCRVPQAHPLIAVSE